MELFNNGHRAGQNIFFSANRIFWVKHFLRIACFLTNIHQWKTPNFDQILPNFDQILTDSTFQTEQVLIMMQLTEELYFWYL